MLVEGCFRLEAPGVDQIALVPAGAVCEPIGGGFGLGFCASGTLTCQSQIDHLCHGVVLPL